jgi:hypothetical protein
MLCRRGWIAVGLTLASSVFLVHSVFAQTAPVQNTGTGEAPVVKHHHHKAHKAAPLVLPPLPPGPLRQLPMDQIPSTPAKVTYEGGLLSISAQNSTLSEILRDVRKLTGASIEIPPGANERVVTNLGPGAPRDVLAGLLNGCSFNYVILGSNLDPNAVSSIILTSKPSSPGDPQTQQTTANVYQNNPGMMPPERFPHPPTFNAQTVIPQPANAQTDANADDKDDDSDNADDNADDQAQQPGQPGQPEANIPAAPDQQQQSDPNQPNAGPKTPEQILEMLRRSQPGAPPTIPTAPPPEQ